MKIRQTFEDFLNEAQQADLIVPANDASDMEEECDYIVELLKKAGVNAGCEAGIGEIEVYLKSKGDLAKAKKALEKNALEYTTNEAEVREGKVEGSGRMAAYQMENSNNGLRFDSIFINSDRYGSKNTMNIKISMYSGGSDGIDFDMPKKLAELNDKVRAGFRSKEPQALTDAENSDREKDTLTEQMQSEIFEEVAKEMDALDKKIGAIVAGIVKKY